MSELHHVVGGDGPPCLVLHGGLGFDHVLYRRTLAPLEERRRVVWFDHRANGRSPGDAADITMERLADDAAELLDHLGLGPCTVIGHSYGGFVAQELALRHPSSVAELVLVCTTPGQLGAGEEPGAGQGPPPPPEMVEAFSALPTTDAEFAGAMATVMPFYLHRTPVDEVLALLDGTTYRVAAMVRGFEVLSTWSSVDRLPSITARTLVFGGRHDLVTSFPQSERIAARVPGAELVAFEHSGHFPWLEEPDAFFATLGRWLT